LPRPERFDLPIWYRTIVYNFILIMANTGMRTIEARNLRWRDVDARIDKQGRQFCCLKVPISEALKRVPVPRRASPLLRAQLRLAQPAPHDAVCRTLPDFGIVSPLTTQLSWTHVVEVPPLKTADARLFYRGEAANRQLATRELRRMIDCKAFEHKENANAQLTEASVIALDTFKDPQSGVPERRLFSALHADMTNASMLNAKSLHSTSNCLCRRNSESAPTQARVSSPLR
jgi:hypothetical protein